MKKGREAEEQKKEKEKESVFLDAFSLSSLLCIALHGRSAYHVRHNIGRGHCGGARCSAALAGQVTQQTAHTHTHAQHTGQGCPRDPCAQRCRSLFPRPSRCFSLPRSAGRSAAGRGLSRGRLRAGAASGGGGTAEGVSAAEAARVPSPLFSSFHSCGALAVPPHAAPLAPLRRVFVLYERLSGIYLSSGVGCAVMRAGREKRRQRKKDRRRGEEKEKHSPTPLLLAGFFPLSALFLEDVCLHPPGRVSSRPVAARGRRWGSRRCLQALSCLGLRSLSQKYSVTPSRD